MIEFVESLVPCSTGLDNTVTSWNVVIAELLLLVLLTVILLVEVLLTVVLLTVVLKQ